MQNAALGGECRDAERDEKKGAQGEEKMLKC